MVMKTTLPDEEVGTNAEPLPEQEQLPVMAGCEEQPASPDTVLSTEALLEELPPEDEIEEELIIEDFTIDGICGVY